MSKAVLISIQPKWCVKIANGEKTVEVRKSRPNLETPFKCYIYGTKKDNMGVLSEGPLLVLNNRVCNGKVIGEFVCDRIRDFEVLEDVRINDYYRADLQYSCLNTSEISEYIGIGGIGYGWHISDLVIYPEPKELGELVPNCRYGQDGECSGVSKVDCPFQRRDYNPDGSINIVDCTKRVRRAPQSWCYVEDLGGADHA